MPEINETLDANNLKTFSVKYLDNVSPNLPDAKSTTVITAGLDVRKVQLAISQDDKLHYRRENASGYGDWKKTFTNDDLNNTGKAIKISSADAGTDLNIEQNYTGNNWVRLQANEQGIKMLRYIDGAWKTVWSK